MSTGDFRPLDYGFGWSDPGLWGTHERWRDAMNAQIDAQKRIIAEQNWRPMMAEQLASLELLRPYERPVKIPQGWRDWYAIGDQLN